MSTSPKLLKKGFKFPIYPTAEQQELINQTFGCCRYVWNKALEAAVHEYKQYLEMSKVTHQSRLIKPDVSGYGFVNRLPAMRKDPETPWLSDVSSVALQQTMLHLGGAFTRFFKEKRGIRSVTRVTPKRKMARSRPQPRPPLFHPKAKRAAKRIQKRFARWERFSPFKKEPIRSGQ